MKSPEQRWLYRAILIVLLFHTLVTLYGQLTYFQRIESRIDSCISFYNGVYSREQCEDYINVLTGE